MEVPRAFGLPIQRPGPGGLILVLYGGPRWSFWRPPLLSEPGVSFVVCPSIHEVLGPYLSYATPSKHPSRGASHSGLFVRGCCVVLYEDSCTSVSEGSLGGIGSTVPSSSDVIPMGSKRFALQGIEYAFLLLSSYFDVI